MRLFRPMLVSVLLVGLAFLPGCSDAKTRKALSGNSQQGTPSKQTGTSGAVAAPGPSPTGTGSAQGTLPGTAADLQQALAQPSRLRFDVRMVPDTAGKSVDDYFDAMGEHPAADTLLLTVFTNANYDLRFAMGPNLRELNIQMEEVLTAARTHYFPEARKGNPAGGLANMIQALNQRADGR